ncbi:hypothetical protein GCM10008024_39890 [Allgaiera indica]|uniref:Uncharacterized protein n=1 Tax=Allgaiera indica TaxID=765699 RepID=A0AAN5A1V8_9RHOB|nr:hypothetical protein GCM10008024_39890 [Allgaiera indica]
MAEFALPTQLRIKAIACLSLFQKYAGVRGSAPRLPSQPETYFTPGVPSNVFSRLSQQSM